MGATQARVGLVVTIAEALRGHVRVHLRGGQAAVSQKFLDAADVGAGVEQVRGETVPQRVRAGARIESGLGEILFQQSANAARREPGAVRLRTRRRRPEARARLCRAPARDGPRYAGGPSRASRSFVPCRGPSPRRRQLHVLDIQAGQFADAQAGRVQRFQDGAVRSPSGSRPAASPAAASCPRARRSAAAFVLPRAAQAHRRVGLQTVLTAQKAAPGAHGGEAAANGALGVALLVQPGQVGAEQAGRQLVRPRRLRCRAECGRSPGPASNPRDTIDRMRRGVLLQGQMMQIFGKGFLHRGTLLLLRVA